MENFLLNFTNNNTEVTSSNLDLQVSADFFGKMDITKGSLKMTISFYTRLYRMSYENCIGLDDWDINDRSDISFNGIPIDNIILLKTTLVNSGLTTIANGLDISDDEIKNEILNQVEQLKTFKEVYGKKARMFNNLSEEEKSKIKLKHSIDNYDKITLADRDIKEFLELNEEGEKSIPTLEKLKELYNQMNK